MTIDVSVPFANWPGPLALPPRLIVTQYDWSVAQPLPQAGRGAVSFVARGTNDIHVAISPLAGTSNPMYEIVIGGWNNTSTAIRRALGGTVLASAPVGLLAPGGDNPLWVSIDKLTGLIQVGRGTVGTNVMLSWQDPSFLATAQYVTFNTMDTPITYSNIQSRWLPGPPIVSISGRGGVYDWSAPQPLPDVGHTAISFVATGFNDVHIALSPKAATVDPMYEIVIGGWGNTNSVIRRNSQGTSVFQAPVGLTAPGGANPLWVSVDRLTATIQVGRGTVGSNVLLSWQDPSVLLVQFAAFSSWDTPISYTNIQTIALPYTVPVLQFGGAAGSAVQLGNPAKLDITGRITVSAWIYPTAIDGLRNIVARGYTTSPPGEMYLRMSSGSYQFGGWNGSDHLAQAPIPASDLNTWVHIAGVYDGAQWILYRNGQLLAQQTDTVGALPVAAGWAIGARGDSNGERPFSGGIADVSIWNIALSASAVQQLMIGATGREKGLAGYWPLDENAGVAALNDITQNPAPGTQLRTTWTSLPRPIRLMRMLTFQNTSRVLLGSPAKLNITGSITLSAWIYPTAVAGYRHIVGRCYNPSTGQEVALRIKDGEYQIYASNGAEHVAKAAVPASDLNTWVHLAGVYDGTSWTLYRNGQVMAQLVDSVGVGANTTDWAIGARAPVAVYDPCFFAGRIADATIWNIGLNGQGVQRLMSGALTNQEPGLVGRWTLDDGAGATASDLSLASAIGTLSGPQWSFGHKPSIPLAAAAALNSSVLQFGGASDSLVQLGNPAKLDITGRITISAWIYPTAFDGTRNIVARGYTYTPQGAIYLRVCGGLYQIGSWNGTDYVASAAAPVSDLNTWVHLAGVYDGTQWILYRNGQVLAQQASTVGALPVAAGWGIGARGDSNGEGPFAGCIADVSIWNIALPASAVRQLMTGATGRESGLVGYWPLDEGAGAAVLGDITQSPALTTQLRTTWAALPRAIRPTRVLAFQGTSRVLLGSPAKLNLTGNITLSAWIYPTAVDGYRNIVGRCYNPSTTQEVALRVLNGQYQIYASNGTQHLASTAIPAADLNTWVHLAGVFDGTSWTLYRNGQVMAKQADAVGVGANTADWAIGARAPISGYDPCLFAGRIADVTIWNIGLNLQGVQRLMSGAVTNQESGLVGRWTLDEGLGTTVIDLSPAAVNGTLSGPQWSMGHKPAIPLPAGTTTTTTTTTTSVAPLSEVLTDPHVHPVQHNHRIITFLSNFRGREPSLVSGGAPLRLCYANLVPVAPAPNTAPQNIPENEGSALDFDGVADIAAAETSSTLSFPAELQLDVWLHPRVLPLPGERALLAWIRDPQGRGLYAQLDEQGAVIVTCLRATPIAAATAAGVLVSERWTHLSISVRTDSSALPSAITVRLGGVAQPVTSTTAVTPPAASLVDGITPAMVFGGLPAGGSRYAGGMSDLRVWSQSTTASLTARLTGTPPGLVAYYHLSTRRCAGQTFYTSAADTTPDQTGFVQALPAPDLPGVTVADLPLDAHSFGSALLLFRQTTAHMMIVDRLDMDAQGKLTPRAGTQQLDLGGVYRGWFATVQRGNFVYIVVASPETAGSATATRLSIHHFSINSSTGALTGASSMKTTSLRAAGAPLHATAPPSLAVQELGGPCLVIALATDVGARIGMLSVQLDSNGVPSALPATSDLSLLKPDTQPDHARWYGHLREVPNTVGIPVDVSLPAGPNQGVLCALAKSGSPSDGVYISAAYFDMEGGTDLRVRSLVDAVTRVAADDPILFQMRFTSLARTGSIESGDPVVFEAATQTKAPYFSRVNWYDGSPDYPRRQLVPGATPDVPPSRLSEVFGIFKVTRVDSDSNNRPTFGSGPIQDGDHVILVPGAFTTAIASGRSTLSADQCQPQGNLPSRVNTSAGLSDSMEIYATIQFGSAIIHTREGQNYEYYVGRSADEPGVWNRQRRILGEPLEPHSMYFEAPRGQLTISSGMELVLRGLRPGQSFDFYPIASPSGQVWSDAAQSQLGTWAEVFELWRKSDLSRPAATPGALNTDEEVYLFPTTSDRAKLRVENQPIAPPQYNLEVTSGTSFHAWQLRVPMTDESWNGVNVGKINQLGLGITGQALPTLGSGVRGALLGFALSVSAPSVQPESDGSVRLTFQGNGTPLRIGGGYANLNRSFEEINDDYYQEGAMAQSFMSPGGFFSMVLGSGASITSFARHVELAALESPPAPAGLVWLVPPPFAATGVVELVAVLRRTPAGLYDWNPVRTSVLANLRTALGNGTFEQGPYKPYLTMPLRSSELSGIADQAADSSRHDIHNWMPQFDFNQPTIDLRQIDDGPLIARSKAAPNEDLYDLGDLATALGLADLDEWQGKVNKDALQGKFSRALSNPAFQSRVQRYMVQVSTSELRTRTRRFASYGGIAGALASFLCSGDFIDYATRLSSDDAQAVLRTELFKLAVLNPDLALATTNHVFYSLALRRAAADPFGVLRTFTSPEALDGLTRVIDGMKGAPISSEELEDLNVIATVREAGISAADIAAEILLKIMEKRVESAAEVAALEAKIASDLVQKASAVQTAADKARYGLAISRVLRWAAVGASIYGIVKKAESMDSDTDKAEFAYLLVSTLSGPGIEATIGALLARYAPPALATMRNLAITAWQGGRNGAQATFDTAQTMAAKLATFGKFLACVGAAAEVVNFVLCAIQLHDAIQGGDSGTIGFASANLVVATAGVVAAGVAAYGAIAGAAMPLAGPFAIAIAVVGLGLMIGGLVYDKEQRRKAEQEQARRMDLWRTWCRTIFTRCGSPATA